MKIFGFEIRRYVSREEQIANCKRIYREYRGKSFYEWEPLEKGKYFATWRNIRWDVVGRSGRWLLIGADSTYAKGCIKKVNNDAVDERCLVNHSYFCYRFINPDKLLNHYHSYPTRR